MNHNNSSWCQVLFNIKWKQTLHHNIQVQFWDMWFTSTVTIICHVIALWEQLKLICKTLYNLGQIWIILSISSLKMLYQTLNLFLKIKSSLPKIFWYELKEMILKVPTAFFLNRLLLITVVLIWILVKHGKWLRRGT